MGPLVVLRMSDLPASCNKPWEIGFFAITHDMTTCLMGCCCGPCLYGKTSEIVEDDCMKPCLLAVCCVPCHLCMYAPNRRNEIRRALSLEENGCMESACLSWFCCSPCANCQESNELKKRNINKHSELQVSAPVDKNAPV